MKTYQNYIHRISSDPNYYGSSVTTDEAHVIISRLQLLIEKRFPGIEVETCCNARNSGITTGPNSDVCREIDEWVQRHWISALTTV